MLLLNFVTCAQDMSDVTYPICEVSELLQVLHVGHNTETPFFFYFIQTYLNVLNSVFCMCIDDWIV